MLHGTFHKACPLLSSLLWILYHHHHIQKAKRQPIIIFHINTTIEAWADLHSPPTISLPSPLSFSAATAAGLSLASPTASSVITAATPASSPSTAPFHFPVSSSSCLIPPVYVSIIGELCRLLDFVAHLHESSVIIIGIVCVCVCVSVADLGFDFRFEFGGKF